MSGNTCCVQPCDSFFLVAASSVFALLLDVGLHCGIQAKQCQIGVNDLSGVVSMVKWWQQVPGVVVPGVVVPGGLTGACAGGWFGGSCQKANVPPFLHLWGIAKNSSYTCRNTCLGHPFSFLFVLLLFCELLVYCKLQVGANQLVRLTYQAFCPLVCSWLCGISNMGWLQGRVGRFLLRLVAYQRGMLLWEGAC